MEQGRCYQDARVTGDGSVLDLTKTSEKTYEMGLRSICLENKRGKHSVIDSDLSMDVIHIPSPDISEASG